MVRQQFDVVGLLDCLLIGPIQHLHAFCLDSLGTPGPPVIEGGSVEQSLKFFLAGLLSALTLQLNLLGEGALTGDELTGHGGLGRTLLVNESAHGESSDGLHVVVVVDDDLDGLLGLAWSELGEGGVDLGALAETVSVGVCDQ